VLLLSMRVFYGKKRKMSLKIIVESQLKYFHYHTLLGKLYFEKSAKYKNSEISPCSKILKSKSLKLESGIKTISVMPNRFCIVEFALQVWKLPLTGVT